MLFRSEEAACASCDSGSAGPAALEDVDEEADVLRARRSAPLAGKDVPTVGGDGLLIESRAVLPTIALVELSA